LSSDSPIGVHGWGPPAVGEARRKRALRAVFDARVRLSPVLAANTAFVFIAVGHMSAVRGARVVWLKTDSAILRASCDYCGARKGRPCVDGLRMSKTGTHWTRRKRAAELRR
jgi:hypothetical protein